MIDIIQAAKSQCYFEYYRDHCLWYKTEHTTKDDQLGIVFSIPIEEIRSTTLPKSIKGIFLLTWMKRYNDMIRGKED